MKKVHCRRVCGHYDLVKNKRSVQSGVEDLFQKLIDSVPYLVNKNLIFERSVQFGVEEV